LSPNTTCASLRLCRLSSAFGSDAMRCIFCKLTSTKSISKEHIVPESLGNIEYILQPGWVCDKCNNYLACEVEAPFLNSWYGRNSRFEMRVQSKRRKVPPAIGFHAQSRSKVDVYVDKEGHYGICCAQGKDETHFAKSISNDTHGTLYIPAANLPSNDYETARFIGKVALEVLALRGMDVPGWNNEVVDKKELDELRNYVRKGRPGFVWPINIRRIYPADFLFSNEDFPPHEVLHEWDILSIPDKPWHEGAEFYVIIAIFGVEYSINLGGPEIESYQQWLIDNKNESFLYIKKRNAQQKA
jgi:HNH endonuclease